MFPAAMVLPMFNGQPLVSPRPAASASAEIPRVWQCAAHDLHHHHHFVRLRFSRRMPLFKSNAGFVRPAVAVVDLVVHHLAVAGVAGLELPLEMGRTR